MFIAQEDLVAKQFFYGRDACLALEYTPHSPAGQHAKPYLNSRLKVRFDLTFVFLFLHDSPRGFNQAGHSREIA